MPTLKCRLRVIRGNSTEINREIGVISQKVGYELSLVRGLATANAEGRSNNRLERTSRQSHAPRDYLVCVGFCRGCCWCIFCRLATICNQCVARLLYIENAPWRSLKIGF